MDKLIPEAPVLIMMYGFPGAGKTYFARQFCDEIHAAHLEEDRIRHELFVNPKYTKQENYALERIMQYMTNEFLNAGISVVYDTNALRYAQRHTLREQARNFKAESLLLWFQVDPDTAFMRSSKRDRRRNDDRFAVSYDVDGFKQHASYMQQPKTTESYVVVSGKHSYKSQRSSVIKKLADLQVIKPSSAMRKMVKPELVNLIPNGSKDSTVKGNRPIILN